MNPYDLKKFSRSFELRKDWDDIKLRVMRKALRYKFRDNILCMKLLSTGDSYIEEENWWGDTYWGVCNGVGENNLGKLLMEVREELRNYILNKM